MKFLTVDEATDALRAGLVVAIPTDTVYGLAASLDVPNATDGVFLAKQRPSDVALPVLVADETQIAELGASWPDDAQRLAKVFWPGPLTIVVSAPKTVAGRVGATDSVGFRQPALGLVRDLLLRTGPLAVSSANIHGQPPCVTANDVIAMFDDGVVVGVLDGGRCDGDVSTVVAVGGSVKIRRIGAILPAEIASIVGSED